MKDSQKKLHIGTWDQTRYSCADDIHTPSEYVDFLFGDAKGFVCIGRFNENRMFLQEIFHRKQATESRLCKYVGKSDTYILMNLLLNRENRLAENVKRLSSLFVDLDCYKLGLSPEDVMETLYRDYIEVKIPMPSVILFSGRGVQLVWKISEDKNAISRWENVEAYLCETLTSLGSDPRATDAARILRLPFTKNSKGGDVHIKEIHNVSYTLYEIIKRFNVQLCTKKRQSKSKHRFGEATIRQRIAAIALARRLNVDLPDFSSFQSTFDFIRCASDQVKAMTSHEPKRFRSIKREKAGMESVLTARLEDLKTLAQLRRGPDCGREIILFLARLWTAELTHDYKYAESVCLEINRLFQCPLPEKEVLSATKSAERRLLSGKKYKYSDSTVMSLLEISVEEETHLVRFNSLYSKNRTERIRAQKRQAYLSRLEKEGKETKEVRTNKKLARLIELSEAGLDRDSICKELEISTATFYRYKKKIEKMNEEPAVAVAKETAFQPCAVESVGNEKTILEVEDCEIQKNSKNTVRPFILKNSPFLYFMKSRRLFRLFKLKDNLKKDRAQTSPMPHTANSWFRFPPGHGICGPPALQKIFSDTLTSSSFLSSLTLPRKAAII